MNDAGPGLTTLPHSCAQALQLWLHVRNDELDAAIDAGLMQFVPCPGCEPLAAAALPECRSRLQWAWAARDRYHARAERLARRTREREALCGSPADKNKSKLPPAAAAILARAKARAAGRIP